MKIFESRGISPGRKLHAHTWLSGLDPALKRKLIMRINLTTFLLLFTLAHVWANARAQSLSLNFEKAPLKTVLKEINKQSGYELWYNDRHLNASQKVTLKINNASLKEVLDKCFENQPLTYEVVDQTIIIKIKPTGIRDKFFEILDILRVTGKVTDEKGAPLSGVNVRIKGTDKGVITGDNGSFAIEVPNDNSILLFSFLGFETQEYAVKGNSNPIIVLKETSSLLSEVGVVNTGYQALPKERATGSFVQIDNELLNRRVSTNILERIDGVAPGVYFNGQGNSLIRTSNLSPRNPGINIRGQSTINSPTDPLIVLDNFPYEGQISNINPNDIESITILKDAAAASIWGARAGNGVIIITSKKGKFNQKMKIELNSNITIGEKPNIFLDRNYLPSSQYIEIEKFLFDKGLFNADIANTTAQTPVSPVIDILVQQRSGTITSEQAEAQLDILRGLDVRNDFNKYIYQRSINQQYALALRGGTSNMAYALSFGYDKNSDNVIRNGFDRVTINATNTFKPFKNFDITANLNYSINNTQDNNTQNLYGSLFNIGGKYSNLYPYAQLADANGNALAIVKNYKPSYVQNSIQNGFLDWYYRPLDEVKYADNNTKVTDFLIRLAARYKILPQLNVEVNYQNEKQMINSFDNNTINRFSTRNLINSFSQFNATTRTFNYIVPKGDILSIGNAEWNSSNLRAQFNYSQIFGKHELTGLLGSEIRDLNTLGYSRTSYGYDDQFGTSSSNLNYNTSYPLNPSGTATISGPGGNITGSQNRYISYYANIAYNYNSRYTLTLSGRNDGANIFGARTNDKVTPLWSTGLAWNISKEEFYSIKWLPYLRLRTTYGFNGNVYNGSAYLTGSYISTAVGNTNAQGITINTAPNSTLMWEKVKNINLGIDFSTENERISGTLEAYVKDGTDLIQRSPLAPQTGFATFLNNAATNRTKGIDITLKTKNLQGQLAWNTTLLLSGLKDKLLKYDVAQTATSMQSVGGVVAVVGKSLYGLYSYRWAGLDPVNGDPQGILNGKISKNYLGIINNFNPDSLVYNGTSRPGLFGSFRNDFNYKGFSLSVNIAYKFNYFIRKSSLTLNYQDAIGLYQNADYASRWQNAGDELRTTVPSMVYPSDNNRNTFYQYSEALVLKGDHIRLQDIRLGYDIPKKLLATNSISRIQIYAYVRNLGILWRANKDGIDPDGYGYRSAHDVPAPRTIAFGLNANF